MTNKEYSFEDFLINSSRKSLSIRVEKKETEFAIDYTEGYGYVLKYRTKRFISLFSPWKLMLVIKKRTLLNGKKYSIEKMVFSNYQDAKNFASSLKGNPCLLNEYNRGLLKEFKNISDKFKPF